MKKYILITLAILTLLSCQQGINDSYEDLKESGYRLSVLPNPSDESITFEFEIPDVDSSPVIVRIENTNGDVIAIIYQGVLNTGMNSISWNLSNKDGEELENGFYIVHLLTSNGSVQEIFQIKR